MRKINFLKTVLGVAAAMLIGVNAFGQIPANYVVYDPAAAAPDNIEYVTLGKTIGYYALPDPVYSPNYTVDGTLGTGMSWTWTNTTNPGTAATLAYPGAANYATISYPVAGNYVITVVENAPAALGGCSGSTRTMNVTAIAAPTGTLSIAPDASWTAIAAATTPSYQKCSTTTSTETQTVTAAFAEAVPTALASYSFQVTEQIELLNSAGTVISTPEAETVVSNFNLAGKMKGSVLGTLPSAAFNSPSAGNFNFTFLTDALAVQQNAGTSYRTKYTYRVHRADETTGTVVTANNDFVSNISQKSDYLGAVSHYNFTNYEVSFIVNPAPVTGPIYHISNTFNY
jgi:hypothetical protein